MILIWIVIVLKNYKFNLFFFILLIYMVNYKSKYLAMKLKYINSKNKIKGGTAFNQPELLIDVNRTGPKSNETIDCFDLSQFRCALNKKKCVWKTSHHPPNYPSRTSSTSEKLRSLSYCKPHDSDFMNKKQNYKRFKNFLNYYINKKNDNKIKQNELVDKIKNEPTEIQMKNYSQLLVENNELRKKIQDYQQKIHKITQQYNENYLQD